MKAIMQLLCFGTAASSAPAKPAAVAPPGFQATSQAGITKALSFVITDDTLPLPLADFAPSFFFFFFFFFSAGEVFD